MKKRNIIIITVLVVLVLAAAMAGLSYYLFVKLPEKREKEEQLREYRELYAEIVEGYSEENAKYDDYEVDVAFLGDSLTAGYDVAVRYPEYLVTNRGIGGDTTHTLNDRLEVSVLDLKPKVCVMLIGGNNPDTMFEDYEEILISLLENMPNTKMVLVSHAPTSGEHWGPRNKTFAHNNVKVKLLAEKYGCDFVDIYSPMLDFETGEIKAEYTVDGAHFTSAGYDVVTSEIKPVVDKLLNED